MLDVPQMAGATGAGCASTLVGHPLDTIKVHMQTNPKLQNTLQATKYLMRRSNHSPLVLFRGMAPPLVNAVAMNTVMFSVFRHVKSSLPENMAGASLAAGIISGFGTAFLSTPTDYIKIQAQIHGIGSSTSVFLVDTIRSNPMILFRGHIANLGREGLFTMVYLGLYDQLRYNNNDASLIGDPIANSAHPLLTVAAISSFTGGLAWVASYPLDTIKSILQASTNRITIREAFHQIWSTGGYKAFYRGCGASTGRAMLVTSIRMISYEWILTLF
jgi:solute carrier family 25 carnitine/acylcarnitine transporter 20/29